MDQSRSQASLVDRVLQASKWPAAWMAVLLAPFAVHALGLWIRRLGQFPMATLAFACGSACIVALCRSPLADSRWVHEAISFERRWTQGLIGFLFFLSWRKPIQAGVNTPPAVEGESRWLAKDNWLVVASPYFLPTASMVIWAFSWFLFPSVLRSFVLGLGVAYHIASVVIQWKHGTPESRHLGNRFGWMFLVPANLLVVGLGFAFALNGFAGLHQFVLDLLQPLQLLRSWVGSRNGLPSTLE